MKRLLTFILLLISTSAMAQPIYREAPIWKSWKGASNEFQLFSLFNPQYVIPMGRTNAWTITELPTNSMFGFWNSNGTLAISRNTNGTVTNYIADTGGSSPDTNTYATRAYSDAVDTIVSNAVTSAFGAADTTVSNALDAAKLDIDGANAASTMLWPAVLMKFPVGATLNLATNQSTTGIRAYGDYFKFRNGLDLVHIHENQVEFTNNPPLSWGAPTNDYSLMRRMDVNTVSNALQSGIDGKTNRFPLASTGLSIASATTNSIVFDVFAADTNTLATRAWATAADTVVSNASIVSNAATIYVSTNGNNSTGTRNIAQKPFLTVTAALTAAQPGDTLFISPGTYAETISTINKSNITIIGHGRNSTRIEGNIGYGTNTTTVGISFVQADWDYAINPRIESCWIYGSESDAVLVTQSATTTSTGEVWNCSLDSEWDVVGNQKTNWVIRLFGCDIYADSNNSGTGTAQGIFAENGSIVEAYGCRIRMEVNTDLTSGVYADFNSIVRLYGCTVRGFDYDLYNAAGTIEVNNTDFDSSKTFGTISNSLPQPFYSAPLSYQAASSTRQLVRWDEWSSSNTTLQANINAKTNAVLLSGTNISLGDGTTNGVRFFTVDQRQPEMLALVAGPVTNDVVAATNMSATVSFPFPVTLAYATVNVRESPATTGLILDVNTNGTTIFSNTNKLTVSVGSIANTNSSFNSTTIPADTRITVDVDQAPGSGTGRAPTAILWYYAQ